MRRPEVRGADTVHIIHSASGAEAVVTRKAFERRSSRLGWVIADAAPPPVVEVDEKEQLRQILRDRGVEGFDGRTGLRRLQELVDQSGGTE